MSAAGYRPLGRMMAALHEAERALVALQRDTGS